MNLWWSQTIKSSDGCNSLTERLRRWAFELQQYTSSTGATRLSRSAGVHPTFGRLVDVQSEMMHFRNASLHYPLL